MKIAQQMLPAYTPAAAPSAPSAPAQPAQLGETLSDRFSFGEGAATVGGGIAGAAAGALSGTSIVLISRAAIDLVAQALPQSGPFAPTLKSIVELTGSPIVLAAAAGLGALQGAKAGGAIAYQAASGAEKLDLARTAPPEVPADSIFRLPGKGMIQDLLAAHRESGAELRQHLGNVGDASSFGGAIAQGAEAGICLMGPAGGSAGKVQGAILGFLVGGAAGLPLLALANHPAVLIPTALAGAALGAKVGPYVGYAANTVAAGAVGALGGAATHGAQKLFGQAA